MHRLIIQNAVTGMDTCNICRRKRLGVKCVCGRDMQCTADYLQGVPTTKCWRQSRIFHNNVTGCNARIVSNFGIFYLGSGGGPMPQMCNHTHEICVRGFPRFRMLPSYNRPYCRNATNSMMRISGCGRGRARRGSNGRSGDSRERVDQWRTRRALSFRITGARGECKGGREDLVRSKKSVKRLTIKVLPQGLPCGPRRGPRLNETQALVLNFRRGLLCSLGVMVYPRMGKRLCTDKN